MTLLWTPSHLYDNIEEEIQNIIFHLTITRQNLRCWLVNLTLKHREHCPYLFLLHRCKPCTPVGRRVQKNSSIKVPVPLLCLPSCFCDHMTWLEVASSRPCSRLNHHTLFSADIVQSPNPSLTLKRDMRGRGAFPGITQFW